MQLLGTAAQDGIPSGQTQDERAAQQFRQADTDRSGSISLDEFVAYCHGSCASRARLELRTTLGPSAESEFCIPASCMRHFSALTTLLLIILYYSNYAQPPICFMPTQDGRASHLAVLHVQSDCVIVPLLFRCACMHEVKSANLQPPQAPFGGCAEPAAQRCSHIKAVL